MQTRPLLSWAVTSLVAAAIVALTLTPGVSVLDLTGVDLWDKAQHALAFALLVLPNACCNRRALPRTMLAAALLGGVIELVFRQRRRGPVGRLRGLGEIDAQKFAHQILQAVAVGIGAGEL